MMSELRDILEELVARADDPYPEMYTQAETRIVSWHKKQSKLLELYGYNADLRIAELEAQVKVFEDFAKTLKNLLGDKQMIDTNKKSKLTGATIAGSEYPQSISFPTGVVYNQAYLDMVVNEQTQLIIERVKNEVIGDFSATTFRDGFIGTTYKDVIQNKLRIKQLNILEELARGLL